MHLNYVLWDGLTVRENFDVWKEVLFMENDIKLGLKEVNDARKEVYYTVLVVKSTTDEN